MFKSQRGPSLEESEDKKKFKEEELLKNEELQNQTERSERCPKTSSKVPGSKEWIYERVSEQQGYI